MKSYSSQSNLISLSSYPSSSQIKQRPWWSVGRIANWDRLWYALMNSVVGSSEPKIERRRDREGNWQFHVYDPATRQSILFNSEREVRIWLDERYYQ